MANIPLVVYRHVSAQLATLKGGVSGVKFSPKPVLQSVTQLTHNLVVSKSILSIFTYLQLLQFHNILGPGARWLRWQSKGGEERHRASICLMPLNRPL